MKTSRVAAIATAVALAFTLGACSTPAATTTSTKASVDPASLKASLTWWDTSDATNEAPAFKSLIADFNKVYPNVTIDY
jgi:arabinogalactan oligomer/maltooligosaccharide transport system substrate-binding protein